MFRRFKEISSEIKTSIKKEEKDGKHEDETVIHLALMKYYRERDERFPEWLGVRAQPISQPEAPVHVSEHNSGSSSFNKFGARLTNANGAIIGQVEQLKPRMTSRFGNHSASVNHGGGEGHNNGRTTSPPPGQGPGPAASRHAPASAPAPTTSTVPASTVPQFPLQRRVQQIPERKNHHGPKAVASSITSRFSSPTRHGPSAGHGVSRTNGAHGGAGGGHSYSKYENQVGGAGTGGSTTRTSRFNVRK